MRFGIRLKRSLATALTFLFALAIQAGIARASDLPLGTYKGSLTIPDIPACMGAPTVMDVMGGNFSTEVYLRITSQGATMIIGGEQGNTNAADYFETTGATLKLSGLSLVNDNRQSTYRFSFTLNVKPNAAGAPSPLAYESTGQWTIADGCERSYAATLTLALVESDPTIKVSDTYIIADPFSLEDGASRRAKMAYQWKIDKAEADAKLAEQQGTLATKKYLLVADKTYALSLQLNSTEQSQAEALAHIQTLIPNPGPNKAAIDTAYASLTGLVAAHARLEQQRAGFLSQQDAAAASIRQAATAFDAAQAQVVALKRAWFQSLTQSAVKEVDVTADGILVFKSTWDAGNIASNLDSLDALLKQAKMNLDDADAGRGRAEDAFSSLSGEADKRNAELVDMIMLRARADVLVSLGVIGKDAIQGFAEGGPPGALAAMIFSIAVDKLIEAGQGEEDLEGEARRTIEGSFHDQTPEPSLESTAKKLAVMRVVDASYTGPASAISGAIAQDFDQSIKAFVQSVLRHEKPTPIYLQQLLIRQRTVAARYAKLSEEAAELGHAFLHMGPKSLLQAIVKNKKAIAGSAAKVGLNVVIDWSAGSIKDTLKQAELDAWLQWFIADKMARLQYGPFVQASQSYRDARASYDKLYAAYQTVLDAAESRHLFKTSVDLPFKEGSTVAIALVPPPSSNFGSARLGGEAAVPQADGFQLQAKGLASDGKDPRGVNLELVQN